MVQILRDQNWRLALAAGLLIALMICLAVIAALPIAAGQFPDLFRGWESDNYHAYPTSENPKDFYGRVFGKTRIAAIKQTWVDSTEQASQLAGFHVLLPARLPDGMEPTAITNIGVMGPHAYRMEVNLIAARGLLQAAGLPANALSSGKEHLQVTASIKPGVVVNQGQGARWFTLIEGRNPEVIGPDRGDSAQLRELGELGLRFLGLSPADARQFSDRMNWASILVLPPADMTLAERVSINGDSGYVLRSTEQGIDHNAVLWEADGVLYGIYGGLSPTELLAMAESLK